MARGGARPGAGRKPGVPNKVTQETRNVLKVLFEKKAAELSDMIDECRYGIEIEKTMADGRTVTGRLNADAGKAAELMLKMAEFVLPKLGKVEHDGPNGGPIQIVVQTYGESD